MTSLLFGLIFFGISHSSLAAITVEHEFFVPETSNRLREAQYSPLYTSIVYSASGPLVGDQDSIIALFGGTGAKSAEYGIGSSFRHAAVHFLDRGWDVIGFQNPMYWQDSRSDDERRVIVDRFGTLEAQRKFMRDSLSLTVKEGKRLRQANNRAAKNGKVNRQYALTRSTSTGVILEELEDYLKRGVDLRDHPFRDVDALLLTGLLGHTVDEMEEWITLEKAFLDQNEGLEDPLTEDKNRAIFGPMTWAPVNENSKPVVQHPKLPVPRLVFVVGVSDPLISAAQQLRIISRYRRLHPNLEIHAIVTDTFHNSVSALTYMDRFGRRVKVRDMARMKDTVLPYLEFVMAHPTDIPGFHIHIDPRVKARLRRCAIEIADEIVAQPNETGGKKKKEAPAASVMVSTSDTQPLNTGETSDDLPVTDFALDGESDTLNAGSRDSDSGMLVGNE